MSVLKVTAAVYQAEKLPREDRVWVMDRVKELANQEFGLYAAIRDGHAEGDPKLARRRCTAIKAAVAILDAIDV